MKAKPDPDADPNKPIDPTAPTTRQVPILGYEYQFKARRILEMQMVRAGLMMANALEQIFTPAKASGPNYFTQRKSPGRCESMFGG